MVNSRRGLSVPRDPVTASNESVVYDVKRDGGTASGASVCPECGWVVVSTSSTAVLR